MHNQLGRPDQNRRQKDAKHQAREHGSSRFVQNEDKQASNDDGDNLAELLERLEGAFEVARETVDVGPADQFEYGEIQAKGNNHANENKEGPKEPTTTNIALRRSGGIGYTLRHDKFPFGKL